MELKSIHVCLEVQNFRKAMEFYGPLFEVAGFSKTWSDDATYAGHTNGNMTIFIGESKPRRVIRKPPTGEEFVVTDHVGFSVGKREDVDAIVIALEKAGIKPLFSAQEYREFGPGFYAATFCDADNNVIEFGHRSIPAPSKAPQEAR